LFRPDDPLAPPKAVFDEPWQAQALALADTMVQAGHLTTTEWAEALSGALREGEVQGAPDTLETYYCAVLHALERLCEARAGISGDDRALRRAAWEAAYRRTPHGQPVEL
jgi:nitrile hydratase accessory protein